MQIVINIPKEFEEHFNSDKFEDSLQRVRFDIHKAFVGNKDILSGNYEIETLDMLTEAFLNGTPLPKGYGDLVDKSKIIKAIPAEEDNCTGMGMTYDEMCAYNDGIDAMYDLVQGAKPIIEADKESEK